MIDSKDILKSGCRLIGRLLSEDEVFNLVQSIKKQQEEEKLFSKVDYKQLRDTYVTI